MSHSHLSYSLLHARKVTIIIALTSAFSQYDLVLTPQLSGCLPYLSYEEYLHMTNTQLLRVQRGSGGGSRIKIC